MRSNDGSTSRDGRSDDLGTHVNCLELLLGTSGGSDRLPEDDHHDAEPEVTVKDTTQDNEEDGAVSFIYDLLSGCLLEVSVERLKLFSNINRLVMLAMMTVLLLVCDQGLGLVHETILPVAEIELIVLVALIGLLSGDRDLAQVEVAILVSHGSLPPVAGDLVSVLGQVIIVVDGSSGH